MTSRNYLLKSLKGNIRRNFWLMILFFLAFLAAMPVSTLTALDGARHIYGISQVYLRNTFINCIGNSLILVMVAVCGALAALAVFFYLYSQEKTDFYHSLPLKREELFTVQFLSGFLMFLIPYIINVLFTLAVGFFYGGVDQTALGIIGAHSLLDVIYFLAIYGAAVLAILLTGNLFMGILGFMVLMFYGPVLNMTFIQMNGRFFETLVQELNQSQGVFLSPFTAYIAGNAAVSNIEWLRNYLLYGVILALILILGNIWIYRMRSSESFHKAIAFRKLEPVIKICIILPAALLVALSFSGYMYNQFLWMVVAALVLALVFSMIFDFLCTMDISRAVKPKVSTGVILAGLILILGGYRTDITGVDTFLPKEDRIASMSLYLPSITTQFQYPENTGTENPSSLQSLTEQSVENFEEIYALAEKGVDYFKENQDYASDVQTLQEGGDTETTMVSVYIGYHLKSGQNVYRMYYLPETKELVENIGRVYDNWEYRESILPTTYISAENIDNVYTYSFSETEKPLTISDEKLSTLIKTYQSELENMTFAQSQEEQIVGWMEVHEGIETEESSMEYSIDSSYSYSYNLPVYTGFEKTRAMLEKMGNPMPESIDQDQVESIVLSRYLYEDGEDQYLKKEYTSQEDIQKILPQATFGEGRFSVGSHMNYDVTCEIFWKDEEKENLVFSIFEDSSLTEILEQLNQANSD